jgi:nucleoside-diphosphate-sugar epimerase
MMPASFPLRRRIHLLRDGDHGARGPLVNFIMTHYKTISLCLIFLFATNTIRVGITSLDIGVRDNEHLPPEMQHKVPSSLSFSSSEDSTSPTRMALMTNANSNSGEFGATAATTMNVDKTNAIPGVDGENQSVLVADSNMEGEQLDQEPHPIQATDQSTTSTSTSNTKISSGAAMSLGSFQIPVQNIQPPPQMNHNNQAPSPLVGAPKNIMVIGGMGFIGFHTCLHLRQLGHSVVSYDIQTETDSTNVDKLHILRVLHDIPAVQGDVCDSSKLYATLERYQVTHVIYLASQSYERGHGHWHQDAAPAANATYIEEGITGTLPADENGNIAVDITPAELQEEVKEGGSADERDEDQDGMEESSNDVFALRGRQRVRRFLQNEEAAGDDADDNDTNKDGDDEATNSTNKDADDGSSSFSFLNLAAPTHAFEYPPNNLDCFANLLDIVRRIDIHVVYASSTHGFQFQDRGVYQDSVHTGGVSREEVPHPAHYHPSIKRSNELMAESYSILYDISTVGVRFPTVYGPFGRPDFTYYKYLQAVVDDAATVPTAVNATTSTTLSSTPTIQIPYIMTRDNIDSMVKQEMQLSLIHVDDVVKNLLAALDLTQDGASILTVGRACATPASTIIKMMEDSLNQIRHPEQLQPRADQHNANGVEPVMIDADNEYAHTEQYVDRSMDPQAQALRLQEAQVADTEAATNTNEDAISQASLTFDPEHTLLNITTSASTTTAEGDGDSAKERTMAPTTRIEYVDVTNEPLMSSSPIFANMTTPRCSGGKTHNEIVLWEGIHALMYWYEVEGGKDRDAGLTTEQTSTQSSQAQSSDANASPNDEGSDSEGVLLAGPPTDICHVTASFAETDDKADKVPSVAHLSHESPNRYLFFTNLPELECDGWERIVMREMPFRRFITQSRWPKFMGWMHPDLQNCKVVLYADAIWRPQLLAQSEWEGLANLTLASDAGITQQIRPFNHSGMRELNFIKGHRKDIKRNVAASREWFLSQGDFNNTSTSYRNNAFVYDPHNANFRQLMTTFWTHYAQEEDSWRDQPLYRYLVNKLKLSPALYPTDKAEGKKGQVRDYWEEKGKKGFNGHHYKDGDDNANTKPKQR